MKVLFLDIDGVLNNKAFRDENGYLMSSEYVLRLLEIIRETGCHIVVSSNWRLSPLEEIKEALYCNGFDNPLTDAEVKEITDVIFSRTSDLVASGSGSRTDEIVEWVQAAVDDGQCIDSWVAIDDLSLDLPSINFVQTDDEVGLTDTQVQLIIDRLNTSDVEAIIT